MKTVWIVSTILLLHAACLQGISPPNNPPSPNTKPDIQPNCTVRFPNLKTTVNIDPEKGFNDEPRTRSEAEKAGFELIASGCKKGKDKHPLPGEHYTQRLNETTGRGGEIILIFDVNGFIAGMSSVIPVNSAEDPNPNLFKHPTLQKLPGLTGTKDLNPDLFQHPTFQILPGLNCTKNYGSTVYFIHPSRVCSGRSDEEFKKERTGTGLYIVNGPTVNDTITVPLDEPDDETKKDKILYRAQCTLFYGTRYFLHDPTKPNSVGLNCGVAPGIQVIYHAKWHGLNGFAFFTPVSLLEKRWESLESWEFKYMYGDTYPRCYDRLAKNGWFTLMHVYFGPFRQFCSDSGQYNDPRNDLCE